MTATIGQPARAAASVAAALITLTSPVAARAEGVSWNGFAQTHVAERTRRVDCPPGIACDFPAAELRGQLKAEGRNASGNADFVGRFDLLRDAAVNDTRVITRELYGDATSQKASARLGRQVITWGVGDLLFINDTFPKDYVALFTGEPMQYLKLGSDALKLDAYPGSTTVELVAAGFRPDHTPTARRFILPDPLPAGLPRRIVEPDHGLADLEMSGRVSRYLGSWELAGYASRTHYRSPAWRVTGTEIVGTYPRLNTVGASLTGPVAKGVLSLEAGYYDSPQDPEGRDPSIENSQLRALVGYSRQLWEDGTLGLQLYGEWMRDYAAYLQTLPAGFPVKNRLRKVATVRFTQLFAHQTLTFNVFAFIGISEKDHYIIPSLRYAFSDNVWAEVGGNFFGGNRSGQLGSLQDNSNVYVTVRYAF
ncbi:MAG: hypothetical protein M0015_18940 [Betaproteobacteria bacterium]|nr:hypothetical protein [Betaproteobacteria bacterium]